jgi:hypothetical protein
MDMNIIIKFTNEMSGRLTAKYKFDVSPEFNYLISKKELEESEPVEDEVEESDEVQEEEDREDNDPQELPEEYNKEE